MKQFAANSRHQTVWMTVRIKDKATAMAFRAEPQFHTHRQEKLKKTHQVRPDELCLHLLHNLPHVSVM